MSEATLTKILNDVSIFPCYIDELFIISMNVPTLLTVLDYSVLKWRRNWRLIRRPSTSLLLVTCTLFSNIINYIPNPEIHRLIKYIAATPEPFSQNKEGANPWHSSGGGGGGGGFCIIA
jgi:hypothetical protein